jgi:hypothetical protein
MGSEGGGEHMNSSYSHSVRVEQLSLQPDPTMNMGLNLVTHNPKLT